MGLRANPRDGNMVRVLSLLLLFFFICINVHLVLTIAAMRLWVRVMLPFEKKEKRKERLLLDFSFLQFFFLLFSFFEICRNSYQKPFEVEQWNVSSS